jgi:hypothetical protein
LNYNDLKCQWIDREDLWERADKFRSEYWPENILPVDTEKIVEIRLQLEIEPLHGLLSDIDMDAYLKRDLSGIVVDYDCYMNVKYTNRMRFSFAHELGHFVLHKDIYTDLDITSPEEWRLFILNVPENEYRNFEWQANEFAGRLLVPHERLVREINNAYKIIQADKKLAVYIQRDPDAVLSRISPLLCKTFGVSETVIETRVKREALWPPPISNSV